MQCMWRQGRRLNIRTQAKTPRVDLAQRSKCVDEEEALTDSPRSLMDELAFLLTTCASLLSSSMRGRCPESPLRLSQAKCATTCT
jgi:hypothetical protein